MGQGYQDSDYEVIDYELYHTEGIARPLRGPDPGELTTGQYIAFVGAAQTFGRYAERPFPVLIGDSLGAQVLNLGVAGAGPAFFLDTPQWLRHVNRAAFAVIQVMSGRSESNSRFDSRGLEMLTLRGDGRRLGAGPAWAEFLQESDRKTVVELVDETRRNWVASYVTLLDAIEVPKVLLWVSRRDQRYPRNLESVNGLFGDFPQLVDQTWVDAIASHADSFVSAVSSRGMPQQLVNRFSGEAANIAIRSDLGGGHRQQNAYYPSSEMHEDVRRALLPTCEGLWRPRSDLESSAS